MAACTRVPAPSPPPEQRDGRFDASAVEPAFIKMDSWNAGEFIVRDIGGLEGTMRWTYERPELRFPVYSSRDLVFEADIGIAAATLAKTGPITVRAEVNGHPLPELACVSMGLRKYWQPVPPEWLKEGEYNRVVLRASKVYVAGDGVKLGFVLYRAGFAGR